MQSNYPIRQLEPIFAYLTSGRDVRMFYVMLAAIAATCQVNVMFWTVIALSSLLHANFLWRIILLRTRMDRA